MQFLSISRRRTDDFPPETFTPELNAREGARRERALPQWRAAPSVEARRRGRSRNSVGGGERSRSAGGAGKPANRPGWDARDCVPGSAGALSRVLQLIAAQATRKRDKAMRKRNSHPGRAEILLGGRSQVSC